MKIVTRPPLRRLLAIDRLIREGRYPNSKSLSEQLEVNARTIQRDIEFMRDSLQAPLDFCRKHNGYLYRTADFQLPLIRLSRGELVALLLTEQLIQQFQGKSFERDLRVAMQKLTDSLPELISTSGDELQRAIAVVPGTLTPQQVWIFEQLAEAVLERQRLEMRYWTAERDVVSIRQVDPYHLVLIEGDWFLVGYCHQREAVRMFATQRVRALKTLNQRFEYPEDFSLGEYLEGSYRSVRGAGRLWRVSLRFSSVLAGRVREKVWHASQRFEECSDGSLLLYLQVTDLRELRRQILWWGSGCRVIEPAQLIALVREEAEAILASLPEQDSLDPGK